MWIPRDIEPRLRRHSPPVILDEVQYAPALFRHLKVAVDSNRGRNGQFLLTGSQRFTLMKGISESLAGRADIVELETLSLSEIRARGLRLVLKQLLLWRWHGIVARVSRHKPACSR